VRASVDQRGRLKLALYWCLRAEVGWHSTHHSLLPLRDLPRAARWPSLSSDERRRLPLLGRWPSLSFLRHAAALGLLWALATATPLRSPVRVRRSWIRLREPVLWWSTAN